MSALDEYKEGVFLIEDTYQGVSVAKSGVSVANLGMFVDSI
jgi:nitric oxide reductase activation protein